MMKAQMFDDIYWASVAHHRARIWALQARGRISHGKDGIEIARYWGRKARERLVILKNMREEYCS